MDYQNVKGTHDIILDDSIYYDYIISVMTNVATSFNYHKFVTPIIESSDLFIRGKNDSSDMVRKQMYTFNDLGNRSITLRPEGTASIARCIVNNKLYANNDFPIKAYYYGPVFRYERPKAGTYRQFHQFGVESIGTNNAQTDVETLLVSYQILQYLGFEKLVIKINTLGDEESRNNYRDALIKYFTPLIDKMCPDCQQRLKLNPLRILDCKSPEDQELIKNAPKISDYLNEASLKRFNECKKLLETLNIQYEVDEGLVRGLDYYSHLVYEFQYISKKSQLNVGSIGGGGHYDNLISEVGGPSLAGVGFAFGIERIFSLLKDDELLPKLNNGIDFFIMPLDEKYMPNALDLANYLTINYFIVDICLEKKSFKTMFHKAINRKAKFAIIFGENEINNKSFIIKDLNKETQDTVKYEDFARYVNEKCRPHEEHDHCCCHHEDGEECDCGCEEGHECHCEKDNK